MIGCDWSQLEMRILAHYLNVLFKDRRLTDDLAAADLHGATAIRVFGADSVRIPTKYVSLVGKDSVSTWAELAPFAEEKDDKHKKWLNELKSVPRDTPVALVKRLFKALRNSGKIVNFSVAYGKTEYGLGVDLRDEHGDPIGVEAARAILGAYFQAYPGVPRYKKWAIKYARRHGYSRTLGGRYRKLSMINAESNSVRRHEERKAVNGPIQGSAADIAQEAQLRLNTQPLPQLQALGYFSEKLASYDVKPVMQIHDELIFEAPRRRAEDVLEEVKAVMQRLDVFETPFSVPLPVDGAISTSWYGCK